MKTIIYILCGMLLYSQSVKADTVDFWHVYYNGIKIREYNETFQYAKNGFEITKIVLKIDSIKSDDSIKVKYYSDSRFGNPDTYLAFHDSSYELILGKEQGTSDIIAFPLKTLVAYKKSRGKNLFEIFYSTPIDDKPDRKQLLLFIIKLE